MSNHNRIIKYIFWNKITIQSTRQRWEISSEIYQFHWSNILKNSWAKKNQFFIVCGFFNTITLKLFEIFFFFSIEYLKFFQILSFLLSFFFTKIHKIKIIKPLQGLIDVSIIYFSKKLIFLFLINFFRFIKLMSAIKDILYHFAIGWNLYKFRCRSYRWNGKSVRY